MRLELRSQSNHEPDVVVFEALLPATGSPCMLRYRTRTGAVLALDGETIGAFDREHDRVIVPPAASERVVKLTVERRSLPTHGLPSGPTIAWWWLKLRSRQEPQRYLDVDLEHAALSPVTPSADMVLWGHSHLDVAWLWTYEEASRKAVRTFANALALIEIDASFVFMQSQPQLYRFVEAQDPKLFARVATAVRDGRFDPTVAALWVEPDCNVPSGESLLRQMLYGHRYCVERFGVEPEIAWLPDSFGFARTLPTLLAHAGIRFFGTTKLQWNDTTRFPYPQFRWRGPDQSEIISALLASYDGEIAGARIVTAQQRKEPLVVGYGDGGGGPTVRDLERASDVGRWQHPLAWYEHLASQRDSLPVHDDELYLEYHRGVYTTHHDVKAANAALERALSVAEERVAWCLAVHAPRDIVDRLSGQLNDAWTIVLRNQFHDVLPGTSIAAVYEDARAEYERAHAIVDAAASAAQSALPRAPRRDTDRALAAPRFDGDAYVFENGIVQARVLRTGAIVELCAAGRRNVVAQANILATYDDKPSKWEAWNIDAGYERTRKAAQPQEASIVAGGLEIPFRIGRSRATMRITLAGDEPFVRVDLAVDWLERRKLLRMESWLAIESERATFGAPHGVVHRSTRRDTPEERARFEVPGQRYALARDASGGGLAIFALDTYGWSARTLRDGGLLLGHSLLRSTTWPDPLADRGEHRLAWAFAPIANAPIGAIEAAWEMFAHDPRVRLFESDDESVIIVACKVAEDGDGVIVRLRECDGASRRARVRCGARMREVLSVDALERPLDQTAPIEGESFLAALPAYGLRSYRVRF